MTLSDLFASVRASTADALSEALASMGDAHVEPAYRTRDGSLALEGAWELPCRADLIPRQGLNAGEALETSAKSRLEFDGFELDFESTEVRISPFDWDMLSLTVCGLDKEAAAPLFKEWFWRWFDQDDRNELNQDGFFGVVHYMSDPAYLEDKVTVQIDLGSGPTLALHELLFALSDAGASGVWLRSL